MLKRHDGRRLKGLAPFQTFYTYLMPGRVDASVWAPLMTDAEPLLAFLELKKQGGLHYTVFQVVIAALIRTASRYPQLNRFIYGHRIYARTEYVISFAVSVSGETVFRKVRLDPSDALPVVHRRMSELVSDTREHPHDSLDNSVDFLMKLPRFLAGLLLKAYPWMVHKGLFPKKFVDEDILYASAIVSNLGTFGMRAPYHHLYEWGSASVFLTVGTMEPCPALKPDGSFWASRGLSFGFTVDERVCDGNVLADALAMFKDCMENPALLESPPEQVFRE